MEPQQQQLPIPDGARLTYAEMANFHPPQEVPQEEFNPELHWAVTFPPNVQVLPAEDAPHAQLPEVSLMRQDGADQAYAIFPEKKVKINNRAPNWGVVHFALVYKRVGPVNSNVFQAPRQDQMSYVAIKVLNKQAVQQYLQSGGEENPYKEICRMREMGDDRHVLRCIEALEDEQNLYIVTRKGHRLIDCMVFDRAPQMEPARIRAIFKKLLQIICYLEKFGICHRDSSPDNFLFLSEDLHPSSLVVYDMALSHRLPMVNGRRVLAIPNGNFGTHAYMAPEIYRGRRADHFCGLFGDLWSAAVILYNLLTNNILCYRPFPDDILFVFNIVAEGLSSDALNERTAELLQGVGNRELAENLLRRAYAHLNMDPEAREVLENLLQLNPYDRWTLAQAMESAYCNHVDGGV